MPIAFRCRDRDCGYTAAKKWTERCPGCGGWFNILQVNEDLPGAELGSVDDGNPVSIQDAADTVREVPRIETGIAGVDHVLSGEAPGEPEGFVAGGVYLLTGDPGAGKTTLLLQTCQALAQRRCEVLYITGEQTVSALGKYARRIGKFRARATVIRETDLDAILDLIEEKQPKVVVVDSVQMVFVNDDLAVGSSGSIKTAIRVLTEAAQQNNVVMIIVGHVTKDGAISGPRALEHHVDVVLHLAGTKADPVKFLRCDSKNRFGETPRSTRFLMTQSGLIEHPVEESPPTPPSSVPPTPTTMN